MQDFDFKDLCKNVFGYKNTLNYPMIFNDYVYYQNSIFIDGEKQNLLFSKNLITGNVSSVTNNDEIIASSVNTYGGICYCQVFDGVVFFEYKSKSIIYKKINDNEISSQIILNDKNIEAVDFCFDEKLNKIYFICENKNHQQYISQICLNSFEYSIVDNNYDFYNCLMCENGFLTFVCWDLPFMPWDKTNIVVFDNNGDMPIDCTQKYIVNKNNYFQPILKNGDLYYSSENDFFDLYKNKDIAVKLKADVFLPLWVYGMKMYSIRDDGGILACAVKLGEYGLYKIIDGKAVDITNFDNNISEISSINSYGNKTVIKVSYKNKKDSIWLIDENYDFKKIVSQDDENMNNIVITTPNSKKYKINNEFGDYFVQYFEYIPKNFNGNIIVKSHGGPTGQTSSSFNPKIQIWTNLGFGVVDVNYSGSTGFGKNHRQRLNGLYGEIEVEELLKIGEILKKQNNINKIFISGSSSGGYDALMCGVSKNKVYDGVCSVYGIGNIKSLIENTHKFEQNYFDVLLRDMGDDYLKQISPLYIVDDKTQMPFLLIHGYNDNVVDFQQSIDFYNKITNNKSNLIIIENEGHGFKKIDNIVFAITKEYEFYLNIVNK